jgi:hypothetical protein
MSFNDKPTVIEEITDTVVDASYVASTTKQANIKLISKKMFFFINDHGRQTPIIIVAVAQLDDRKYAALFNTDNKKAYAVELIERNGQIKEFRDMDGPGQDEEWAVVSNFFLKENVYDLNRINLWIYNTVAAARRGIKPKAFKLGRTQD